MVSFERMKEKIFVKKLRKNTRTYVTMHESALIAPSTLAIRVEFARNVFLFVSSDQNVQTLIDRVIFVLLQFALFQIVVRIVIVVQFAIFSAVLHADQLDDLLFTDRFIFAALTSRLTDYRTGRC